MSVKMNFSIINWMIYNFKILLCKILIEWYGLMYKKRHINEKMGMEIKNLEKYKELNPDKKYYEILGVDEKASYAEINEAFDELSKKFDPSASKEKDAEEIHKILSNAYETLSDPEKRRKYHIEKIESDVAFGTGSRCGAGTAIIAIVLVFFAMLSGNFNYESSDMSKSGIISPEGPGSQPMPAIIAVLLGVLLCGAIGAILGSCIGYARVDKGIRSVIGSGVVVAIILLIVWAVAVIIIDAIVGIIGYALYYASAGSEINVVAAIVIGIFAGIAALIVNIVGVIIQIVLMIIVCIILGIITGAILGPIGWVIGKIINNLKGGPIDTSEEIAWLDSIPLPETIEKNEYGKQ